MHKIIFRLLYPVIKLYWFVFRPTTYGVKCMVICGDEMLMIKNTYGKRRWTFPGGGVEAGETKEQAVIRETKEEVGVTLDKVSFLGEFVSTKEYKQDHVASFLGHTNNKEFKIQETEIAEAKWFKVTKLPEDAGDLAKKTFEFYEAKGNSNEIQ